MDRRPVAAGRARRKGAIALAITVSTALALAACSLLSSDPSAARPCASEHSAARCDAMLAWASGSLGVPVDQIVGLELAPRTTEPPQMDRTHAVGLVVRLADGSSRTATVMCPGVSGGFRPECMPEPHLILHWPGSNGYHDYPEGATPVPAMDPAVAAAATPLAVPRLDIPIAQPGLQRIKVGRATLANGILQESSFQVTETWPANLVLRDGSVSLELVSLDGGRPFFNSYDHGWIPGLERVDVFIVFDPVIVRPGARLIVTDVLVR